jgi:hypothetical protein
MIKFEDRYDDYAYRVGQDTLADTVTGDLEEGQWVTYDTSGNLVISDGSLKSFLAIGSKRDGRNQVGGVPVKKISYLFGAYGLWTDQVNAEGTYTAAVTPLKVTTGGILTPWASATDAANLIAAYAIGGLTDDGFLRIVVTA